MRQVTPDLALELWSGESAHVRLVATSYPVRGLGDLATQVAALQDAMGKLARAADGEFDGMGPVRGGAVSERNGDLWRAAAHNKDDKTPSNIGIVLLFRQQFIHPLL